MENNEMQIDQPAGIFRIRPIEPADSPIIRDIILETLVEYGAVGGGFASSDRDTQQMFEAFQKEGRKYFVLEKVESADQKDGPNVLGGAGITPLPGEPETCELVKMYFRPEIRGLGLGKKLLSLCLDVALESGYRHIYLETIEQMQSARGLYEHLGFKQIPHAMGNTGHFSCDLFYYRELV